MSLFKHDLINGDFVFFFYIFSDFMKKKTPTVTKDNSADAERYVSQLVVVIAYQTVIVWVDPCG